MMLLTSKKIMFLTGRFLASTLFSASNYYLLISQGLPREDPCPFTKLYHVRSVFQIWEVSIFNTGRGVSCVISRNSCRFPMKVSVFRHYKKQFPVLLSCMSLKPVSPAKLLNPVPNRHDSSAPSLEGKRRRKLTSRRQR